MIVYEVNLCVAVAVADAYLPWLRAHVRQMLALPGFLDATLLQVSDPASAPEAVHWCVQYRLRDATALDYYLQQHAPAMRADGVRRFGSAVQASRRILLPD